MALLPRVRRRTDYSDIGADDLTMALFHDRIAGASDPDAAPLAPAVKASRRHSAADEATKALNYDREASRLREAWYAQFPGNEPPKTWVETVFDDAVIVRDGPDLFRVPYQRQGEQITFVTRGAWEPVRQVYITQDRQEIKAVPVIDVSDHAGAMVCLVTTPDTQAMLRGLLPDELQAESEPDHITILYLGAPAEDFAASKTELLQQLTYVAESGGPISGTLGGLARFPASETSDGMDVLVALFDAPGLVDLRVAVMDAADAAEIEPPDDHGFIPHITLAYIDPDAPTPPIRVDRVPLGFDLLTLVWAGERIDIPMTGEGAEWDVEEGEDEGPGLAMALAPAGAVKMLADGRMLVHGIRYGGRDLVGDTFTKATDLGAARSFVGMPVYYDHAQRGIKSQIGHVAAYEANDEGIDFYVELDRHHRYKAVIERLYAEKALGGTTGALPHLVVREGGELKRWIVGELSVSPGPAEPRTLPSTKASAQATPEAPSGATGGELTRLLASTHTRILAYRLQRRYGKRGTP